MEKTSKMKTLVIDPGHGGRDSGAASPFAGGLMEKDAVLDVALTMQSLLHGTLKVVMTRKTDVFVELRDRAAISNAADADLFLSIHCNSAERSGARGPECWTSRGETAADPFATTLARHWVTDHPGTPFRRDMSDGDPDFESSFSVLVHTDAPAVLWELGFLSNPDDSDLIADPLWRDKAAETLAGGIIAHLGLASHRPPEKPQEPVKARLSKAINDLRAIHNDLNQ